MLFRSLAGRADRPDTEHRGAGSAVYGGDVAAGIVAVLGRGAIGLNDLGDATQDVVRVVRRCQGPLGKRQNQQRAENPQRRPTIVFHLPCLLHDTHGQAADTNASKRTQHRVNY